MRRKQEDIDDENEFILKLMRKEPRTRATLAKALGCSERNAVTRVNMLIALGINIACTPGRPVRYFVMPTK